MTKHSLIALAALCMAASAASAQTYGGIVLGSTHYSADCTGGACDKSDTGFKLFGGYKFGGGLAAELSYFDYGKFTGSGTVNGSPVNLTLRGSGFGIGGAYTAEFTPDITGTVRLGLGSNKAKLSATSGTLSGSDSDRSSQLYYGLAAGYKLSPQATVDLSFESTRFKYSGDASTARMFGVGLTYAF